MDLRRQTAAGAAQTMVGGFVTGRFDLLGGIAAGPGGVSVGAVDRGVVRA
jgi:hypothetical protein